jgi:hypothetical protein
MPQKDDLSFGSPATGRARPKHEAAGRETRSSPSSLAHPAFLLSVDRVFSKHSHLCRILAGYARYYNELRTHLSLRKDSPHGRPVQRRPARCSAHPRWASSSILPDVVFGRDNYSVPSPARVEKAISILDPTAKPPTGPAVDLTQRLAVMRSAISKVRRARGLSGDFLDSPLVEAASTPPETIERWPTKKPGPTEGWCIHKNHKKMICRRASIW